MVSNFLPSLEGFGVRRAWQTVLAGMAQLYQPPYHATSSFSVDFFPFKISNTSVEGDPNYIAPIYPILPFTKHDGNPILTPNPYNAWESAYLYNPTAIVIDETIFLIYRAQGHNKTSSLGLAWSTDGTTFTRLSYPILNATEPWEQIGGTEDPRIIRVDDMFYLTYTAYDGHTARLCMATSTNLLDWEKYPPLIPSYYDYPPPGRNVGKRYNWSKSGGIVKERQPDGLFHMYFGDSKIYHATSPDLLTWNATPSENYFAAGVFPWENSLVETGPPPIKTRDGRWLLVYNGMSVGGGGYQGRQYSVGQMLIDPSGSFRPNASDKTRPEMRDGPIARLERPFLWPEADNEIGGQVNKVVFAEGLVQYKGKWYLYYGQADSDLGVAIADVQL